AQVREERITSCAPIGLLRQRYRAPAACSAARRGGDRVERGCAQNRGLDPDRFPAEKQARRTEGGCLPKFPVLFQQIPCAEGSCPTHSRWQQFDIPIGLVAGRSEPSAGLPLACKQPAIAGEGACWRR